MSWQAFGELSEGGSLAGTPRKLYDVDTTALVGLRGLLVLHVVLTDTLRRMHPFVDLCGTLQTPFFFFLSGFVLTLHEGRQTYTPGGCCPDLGPARGVQGVAGERPRYHAGYFWWRRFSRLIPMYWIAILACVYLVFRKVDTSWDNNGGSFDLSAGNLALYLMIFTATTTWLVPLFGFVGLKGYDYIEPTSWFVSSIFFCYWFFPAVLPQLQRLSRSEKHNFIWWFWVLQACPIPKYPSQRWLAKASLLWLMWTLLDIAKTHGADNMQDSMIAATMFPPTRFPVFLMGMLAGLLRLTTPAHKHPENVRVWGFHYLIPPPALGDDPVWWGRFVNLEFLLVLLGLVFPLTLIGIFVYNITYVYLLLILPIFYVPFCYGLTCDQGCSVVSRILRSHLLQALGAMSYQLFLWHEPVNLYFMYILSKMDPNTVFVIDFTRDTYDGNGWNSNTEVLGVQNHDSDSVSVYTLPPWSVPIVLVLALAWSYLMHKFVAEPLRTALNAYNPFTEPSAMRAGKSVSAHDISGGPVDLSAHPLGEHTSLLVRSAEQGAPTTQAISFGSVEAATPPAPQTT